MIIELRGKAIDLTDAMRTHFKNCLSTLENYKVVKEGKMFHADIHVYEKNRIKITVSASLSNARHIKVEAKGNDYYKLVVQAVKDMEKQIRKIQQRLNKKEIRGFKIEARREPIEIDVFELEEAY